MSAIPEPRYTFEEYLERERKAEFRSEFYRGQIFAMAGGSPRHNRIAGNIFAGLHTRLRGTPCRPYGSDQRIRVPGNTLSTYPDASVVCGEHELDPVDRDAITNPRVIVEVLSSSTEGYNRGKKFELYRDLESLREYVLISQDEPLVERFVRGADGDWRLTDFKGPSATLEFSTLGCAIPLAEAYEDVTFGPDGAR